MEMNSYIVYVKVDGENRITAVNSSAFLHDTDGWTEIDRGYTRRHHHAQGNYLPKPSMDERGVFRYLYTPDSKNLWRERTSEEMDADYAARTAPTLTYAERIARLEERNAQLEEALALLLSGATEVSEDG